jgi:VanZ family protein
MIPSPAKRLAAAVWLGLLFLALLTPLPPARSEFMQTLSDAAHGPLFVLTAGGVLLWLRTRTRQIAAGSAYIQAFLIAVMLGGIGEIAQFLFTSTRHAQWKDVFTDACGALAGLGIYAQFDSALKNESATRHQMRWLAAVAIILIISPVVWSGTFYVERTGQAPELLTWSSSWGHHFMRAGGATARIEPLPPSWKNTREHALYISPDSIGRWAGITIEEPLPDWNGYQHLAIELINPNDRPLKLTLRIDDHHHNQDYNDRFNGSLRVAALTSTVIRVPLKEVLHAPAGRTTDLEQISKLVLFEDKQEASLPFYLVSLRLEK